MNRIQRLVSRLRHDDAGTSLAELVVGMALMAIFMSMFTGAVVMMTSSANKVEAVTVSSGNVNQAFLELDRVVRYASALSTPAQSATSHDWYVEASIPQSSGAAKCYQLRVDISTQELQQRTWTVSAGTTPTVAAAGSWVPLANTITNGSAAAGSTTVPFSFPTYAQSLYQQLQVNLQSTSTSPATGAASSTVTFTALNSTTATSTAVCQQWGRP